MIKSEKLRQFLIEDLWMILFSIVVAVLLLKTGVLTNILNSSEELGIIGSFIAGLFFTSAFTTIPAIVALGNIGATQSIFLTAFFGAMGAVIVDFFIYRFARDRLANHLLDLIAITGGISRIKHMFKNKHFRWLTFLIGGFIIASPLPDELGLSILGFSKVKNTTFLIFSFIANFIGILLICLIGRMIF